MVFPTGIGNQNFGVRIEAFEKICTNFEPACAAQCLNCGDSTRLNGFGLGTKNQGFDGLVIGCDAIDGQIAPSFWGCGKLGLGLFDAMEEGDDEMIVALVAFFATVASASAATDSQ